ncbi:MAG: DUF2262 domain-containing protein [Oscillospiraceae bacterium]|nr:DUF2262 domain-containing protein [Oscillospiraceae bacterium]
MDNGAVTAPDTETKGVLLMQFPCKIGISMPEQIRDTFETETHEYLVACRSDVPTGIIYTTETDESGFASAKIIINHVYIAGYIDLTAGIRARSSGWLSFTTDWPVFLFKKEDEQKALAEKRDRDRLLFAANKIYRIRALPPVSCPERPMFNNEKHLQGMYVTEILSDNEHDDYLQNLLDIWFNPVTVHSEEFGDLVLDKELKWYSAEKEWRRKPVPIRLRVKDENEDASAGIALLEQFWKKKAAWDKKLRAFAAKQLLSLANDWAESDDEHPGIVYTEESFAKKLKNESIIMDTDGSFEMWYDDGGIFFGHAVTVYGNVQDGPQEAKMEG